MYYIHPSIVHLPIGILTLYCLFELARFKRLRQQHFWVPLKAVLVIVGFGGILAALVSGNYLAARLGASNVVRIHQLFGQMSAGVFGILAVLYTLNAWPKLRLGGPKWQVALKKLVSFAVDSWIVVALALIGLILMMITGALGGGMVYGPEADPLSSLVFKLLVKDI